MAEIIRCFREQLPTLRLAGIKYGDADRENGSSSATGGACGSRTTGSVCWSGALLRGLRKSTIPATVTWA